MALCLLKWFRIWLLRALTGVLFGVFRLLSRRSPVKRKLPPVSNALLTVSATQLAQKIRRREVSSVEVVQAYIDRIQDSSERGVSSVEAVQAYIARIQEVNPLLNAMVMDRFGPALQEAAQVDKLIEEETGGEEVLEDRLPLLGVPLSVKEAIALKGMPHTTGLVSRRGVLVTTDAPPVAYLKRAGAIPLGVTNTSELCMWSECHNHLYGITNNPYDLERTPGGSSGGEGSLLGAAASVIGLGSDIGGSIRIPSFFCGVFGHKPTQGVVSNKNVYPPASGRQEEYLSTGPMCRYAEDLLPMLRIMAGPNAHVLSLSSEVDLKKLRFFTVPHDSSTLWTFPVNKQLIEIQRKVVHCLEADLGVTIEEVSLSGLQYSFLIRSTYMSLLDKEGRPPLPIAELMAVSGRPVWELLKWIMGKSDHTITSIGAALMEARGVCEPSPFVVQQKETLQREVEELLGTDGVLLYPSHPNLAPKHHHALFRPFSVNAAYSGILNILGLPVTQCPLGLSQEGLPMGVQVVAGKLQDRLSLAVAVYLEETFGGWRDPGAS